MDTPASPYEHVIAAFNRRDWQTTIETGSRLLPQVPQHAGLHYMIGVALMERQQLTPALQYLAQAAKLAPDHAGFMAQYAKALSISRQTTLAQQAAEQALSLRPEDPLILDTLGVVFAQANAQTRAADAFRKAVSLAPLEPGYRFNLATSLVAIGALADAENELEACIEMNPAIWPAHLTLAQLYKQTPSKNHLSRLNNLLAEVANDPRGSLYLHMALFKEYEDLGQYGEAFNHLTVGKQSGRPEGYSIQRDAALVEALCLAFPLPSAPDDGHGSDEPIFVIGMPRSGTTLVERILSSHPSVYSAGELQDFGVALKQLSGSPTRHLLDPDTIGRARWIEGRALGELYLDHTRRVRGQRRHFVDKLPHNFLYAGFIARAFPRARIICLRRDPMDTCISNFRQLFSMSSPYYAYSYDLMDTVRYYLLFDRMMTHWKSVLPRRIFEVRYEDLIIEQEGTTRSLLEHCGLHWHEDCLRFDANDAPVATASAVQVRQPLYRTAIGRWQRYASYLGSVQELLASRP